MGAVTLSTMEKKILATCFECKQLVAVEYCNDGRACCSNCLHDMWDQPPQPVREWALAQLDRLVPEDVDLLFAKRGAFFKSYGPVCSRQALLNLLVSVLNHYNKTTSSSTSSR